MATRKSTGKRMRFEVFKRDHFTCQYCGQQPPTVVLVIDHIEPVSRGGTEQIHNLITACESCNQGKADGLLTVRTIRPDADLLYLETQQEIAELRRFTQALQEKEAALLEVIDAIQDLWLDCSGLDWVPSALVLRGLLDRYPLEIVEAAVRVTGSKIAAGFVSSYGKKWVGYLNGVARNLAQESD